MKSDFVGVTYHNSNNPYIFQLAEILEDFDVN
jgi:hypothetical protein